MPSYLELTAINGVEFRRFREACNVTRCAAAVLCHYSERSLASIEEKTELADHEQRHLSEAHALLAHLSTIMPQEAISTWLGHPHEMFNGATPLELAERGHVFEIWSYIFRTLQSLN